MIVSVSDELIMAYADGELDPTVAAQVRWAVLNDDAIRRKHEIYCSTRALLSRSFSRILTEPVPDRLQRVVRRHPRLRPAQSA